MRLAISNIAWRAEEDVSIASILRDAGAEAIEVAPARLFADPLAVTPAEASVMRLRWRDAGLPVTSMQALLYGRGDLKLFGDPAAAEDLVAYMSRIIALAGDLGAGPLVFGSPGNRRRGELDFMTATRQAVPLFRRLGDQAAAAGCTLCLEPNAIGYGCDFMTTLGEAADVVRAIDHSAVGLVADTGNMQMMGEPVAALTSVVPLIRHLHLSMPNLARVDRGADFIADAIKLMRDANYAGIATIEMRAPEQGAADQASTALTTVKNWINRR